MSKELKKMPSTQRVNGAVFTCYTVMTMILLFAYTLEFIKGDRDLAYTAIFAVLDLGPWIMCLVTYMKNRASKRFKYILSIGFSLLYAFVLLTAAVPTTFVYVFLVLFLLIPYGDMVLCYISGGMTVAANVVSVVIGFANGSLSSADLAIVEIQVIAAILASVFMGVATSVIGKINAQRIGEINEEKEKVDVMLSNTLDISRGISMDIEAVTARMGQLERSVGITRDSMNDVASGANETAESMQEQLLQTEAIVEQVDRAKTVSQNIADDVKETEETIIEGKQNIENLMACVEQSEQAGNVVEAKMKELTESTEQMNTIVEMINSVTKQTALLSLNASIEAARAGEAGRGFAVVADEISSLAKQTSDATVSITSLIGDISASINDVFNAINQLMESNEKQNNSAETMAKNFEKIEACAGNISNVSVTLEEVVGVLAQLNSAIVGGIDNVSAVTEEVSARASQTLEESENDAQVVEDITRVIEEINDKAKRLNQ